MDPTLTPLDPQVLGPQQWALVNQALGTLVLFVILLINTAVSFLIAHAVLPSMVYTEDVPSDFSRYRRMLYPISFVSLLATAFAFQRAIGIAIDLMQQVYPRFAI